MADPSSIPQETYKANSINPDYRDDNQTKEGGQLFHSIFGSILSGCNSQSITKEAPDNTSHNLSTERRTDKKELEDLMKPSMFGFTRICFMTKANVVISVRYLAPTQGSDSKRERLRSRMDFNKFGNIYPNLSLSNFSFGKKFYGLGEDFEIRRESLKVDKAEINSSPNMFFKVLDPPCSRNKRVLCCFCNTIKSLKNISVHMRRSHVSKDICYRCGQTAPDKKIHIRSCDQSKMEIFKDEKNSQKKEQSTKDLMKPARYGFSRICYFNKRGLVSSVRYLSPQDRDGKRRRLKNGKDIQEICKEYLDLSIGNFSFSKKVYALGPVFEIVKRNPHVSKKETLTSTLPPVFCKILDPPDCPQRRVLCCFCNSVKTITKMSSHMSKYHLPKDICYRCGQITKNRKGHSNKCDENKTEICITKNRKERDPQSFDYLSRSSYFEVIDPPGQGISDGKGNMTGKVRCSFCLAVVGRKNIGHHLRTQGHLPSGICIRCGINTQGTMRQAHNIWCKENKILKNYATQSDKETIRSSPRKFFKLLDDISSEKYTKKRKFFCYFCFKTCKMKRLNEHMKVHLGAYKCSRCGINLKDVNRRSHRYQCSRIMMEFSNEKLLNKNYEDLENNNEGSQDSSLDQDILPGPQCRREVSMFFCNRIIQAGQQSEIMMAWSDSTMSVLLNKFSSQAGKAMNELRFLDDDGRELCAQDLVSDVKDGFVMVKLKKVKI